MAINDVVQDLKHQLPQLAVLHQRDWEEWVQEGRRQRSCHRLGLKAGRYLRQSREGGGRCEQMYYCEPIIYRESCWETSDQQSLKVTFTSSQDCHTLTFSLVCEHKFELLHIFVTMGALKKKNGFVLQLDCRGQFIIDLITFKTFLIQQKAFICLLQAWKKKTTLFSSFLKCWWTPTSSVLYIFWSKCSWPQWSTILIFKMAALRVWCEGKTMSMS